MIKNILLKISLVVGLLGITSSIYGQEDERVFFVFDASNGMAANGAQTIVCTKTGRMVITSIGYVNFYDGSDFYQIVHEVKDMYPLKKYSGH